MTRLTIATSIGENGAYTFDGSETSSDFVDFLIGAPAFFIQASKQILDSRIEVYGPLRAG